MKYQELRDILDHLHDLQHVLVGYQHDRDAEALRAEAIEAREALQTRQEAERLELKATMEATISAREQKFERELAVRVSGEKKLEEDYLQQLEAFYAGKKDGEERIQATMVEFRKKMDEGFRVWEKHRDAELEVFKFKMEEEHTIKEELMDSAKRRLDDSYRDREADLEKRKAAELKWVTRVMAERERLLAEMEVEELDGDATSLFSFGSEETPGV